MESFEKHGLVTQVLETQLHALEEDLTVELVRAVVQGALGEVQVGDQEGLEHLRKDRQVNL